MTRKLLSVVLLVVAGECARMGLELVGEVGSTYIVSPWRAAFRGKVFKDQAAKVEKDYYRQHPDEDPNVLDPAPAHGEPTATNPVTISARTSFTQLEDEEVLAIRDAWSKSNIDRAAALEMRFMKREPRELRRGTAYTPVMQMAGNPYTSINPGHGLLVTITNKNGSTLHGIIPEEEYWQFLRAQ